MRVSEVFKGLMFMEGMVGAQLLRDQPDFARGYGNAAANARARGPLSQPPPEQRSVDAAPLARCACG